MKEGDSIYKQIELIQLIEQWQQTDPTIYKSNIKVICFQKGVKPRHIKEALSLSDNMAYSLLNVSHKARIEFLTGLKLAKFLGCDIKDFLKKVEN